MKTGVEVKLFKKSESESEKDELRGNAHVNVDDMSVNESALETVWGYMVKDFESDADNLEKFYIRIRIGEFSDPVEGDSEIESEYGSAKLSMVSGSIKGESAVSATYSGYGPLLAEIMDWFANSWQDLKMDLTVRSIMRKGKKSVEDEEVCEASEDDEPRRISKADIAETTELDELIKSISEKTKATIVKPKETLEDYVCSKVLKDELEEIVDFFKNEKKYTDLGIKIPKGILFKGLPGTGKTYAARCIAGSTDGYFLTCTASSLQGMYVGSGAENIRAVFNGARKLRKASGKGIIIFLDELDSFGSRDNHGGGGGGSEEDRTLNQLLAEMSGFEDAEGIMILGATNYPDRLDSALMRSGRFSRQITIEVPTDTARHWLVQYYFKKLKMPLESELDTEEIAALSKGMTPADISEMANEAALLSVRCKKSVIGLEEINESINKIITKNVRAEDKDTDYQKLVAAHESGHVLAEMMFSHSVPLKVTNYSYGNAGGFTQPSVAMDGIVKKTDYTFYVYGLLGGRAAEEVMFGEVSTGASEDLDRASAMIKRYYSVYHFEEYDPKELDSKVQQTLKEWLDYCIECMEKHKEALTKLTDTLCENRVLYKAELTALAYGYKFIE